MPEVIEAQFIDPQPLKREATIVVHVDAGELVRDLANAPQVIAAELVRKVSRHIPERGAPMPRNGGQR